MLAFEVLSQQGSFNTGVEGNGVEAQRGAEGRITNGAAPLSPEPSPADPFNWFLLRDLSVAAERASRALAAGYSESANLNLAEGRVLLVLAAFPSISAGEVTARTTMDKARVSRALSRLMLMGLVSRKTHRNDKRQAVLRVTSKGRRVSARIEAVARSVQAALLATLSPSERANLQRALQKVQSCAEPYSRAGAGLD